MDNQDIDWFFEQSELADTVERIERPPNVVWQFEAAGFPVFIQTQENANRMRIVAYISDGSEFDLDEMRRLMEANYHSALDARYAFSDGNLVAAFIHPLRELTFTQFLLGMFQTINCAETWGDTYAGGTLTFGTTTEKEPATKAEENFDDILSAMVAKIRGQRE